MGENLSLEPLQVELLTQLYVDLFENRSDRVDLLAWCKERGIDREGAMKLYRVLHEDLDLIASKVIGLYPGLTLRGTLLVEQNGLAPAELIARQDQIRRHLIARGMEARRRDGKFGRVHVHQAMRDGGFAEHELHGNYFFLLETYIIEGQTVGSYRLTDHGIEVAERLELQDSFEARWEAMKLVTGKREVQKRGHDLEDLLAELAASEGLSVESRVRSVGEENDLVISQDYHHFLTSCKWEKGKAKSEYLDILRARIMKRTTQTNGVLVSVGGFSAELVKEAESNTSTGLVVLIGKGDLERLFKGEVRLSEMLLERHTAMVRYRRAIFES